jgi:hypothetical protein
VRAKASLANSTPQKDIACVLAQFGFGALLLPESKRVFDKGAMHVIEVVNGAALTAHVFRISDNSCPNFSHCSVVDDTRI